MTLHENKMSHSDWQVMRPEASSVFTQMNFVVLVNAIMVLVHYCFHPKN
jgi:hypothetical protein